MFIQEQNAAVRGPFYPDGEESGRPPYVEIAIPNGKVYQVYNCPYRVWNHIFIYPVDDLTAAFDQSDTSPILQEIFDISRTYHGWDDPAYRNWFRRVGLDPDRARPDYRLRDADIIGVESGRGQNDTLRKLPLGVPVEPIGFFHQ